MLGVGDCVRGELEACFSAPAAFHGWRGFVFRRTGYLEIANLGGGDRMTAIGKANEFY